MVTGFGMKNDREKSAFGLDRVLLRLAVMGVAVVVAFVALFSRLWFLQVLATEDYNVLARENRVRTVHSEPERGLILDRNGVVLVQNKPSLAITVDKQILEDEDERLRILRRLAKLLDVKRKQLVARLEDTTVSPYKPVAVAYDVPKRAALKINDNPEDFLGVGIEKLPIRHYPEGPILAHVLGYVGEISREDLESDEFKNADPEYASGDIVGRSGVERSYDEWLRGEPSIERIVVNSTGRVIDSTEVQAGRPGHDLVLTIDASIQKITEKALEAGIMAARGSGYQAPDGAAVVIDPKSGDILASASFPSYDPSIAADGFTQKEYDRLSARKVQGSDGGALLNRVTQAQVPPGSTFKVATAGAALATGVIGPFDPLPCPPVFTYGADNRVFRNWTSADLGSMSLARSLETSCDTYYYQLGARMEDRWGAANGDGSEKYQAYLRKAGFGSPTGVDIPGETSGRVPDEDWCEAFYRATNGTGCPDGWVPGYTVNMSIGQGDVLVSPIQMAVNYASVVNGGKVLEPRYGMRAERADEVVKRFKSKVRRKLPIEPAAFEVMKQGLEAVISGANGTARAAFSGFPLEEVRVAGKTGTAQIGSLESGKNYAWFLSYAPADDPKYLVAVYLNRAGHGGESAGPVARAIYEGIFDIDDDIDVTLSRDDSN